jgi:phosphonate degradation associated HDIG domain protein
VSHAFAALLGVFEAEGEQEYLGEPVSMAQHMLQTGAAARAAGAPRSLVVAAVAHDVGHFTGVITGRDLMGGTDNHHGELAASWLAQWFGEAVTEPVRLHVAAKRYLCAVDPTYHDQLSQASAYTLAIQGGPMSTQEVDDFARRPYAEDAVRLRRWDDLGKEPHRPDLSLDDFRTEIESEDQTQQPHAT